MFVNNSGVAGNHVGTSGSSSGDSQVGTKSNSVDSIAGKPPLPPGSTNGPQQSNGTLPHQKTASIRARPASGRVTALEIQEIFDQKTPNQDSKHSPSGHKIYASVSEMKRSKVNIHFYFVMVAALTALNWLYMTPNA